MDTVDDLTKVLEAKSDQLNAADLAGVKRLVITKVTVGSTGSQDHVIHYEGGEKRPYKPSKGMSRIMAKHWGIKPSLHVGKLLDVYNDPTVIYAGKEVGGIVICGMSDLNSEKTTEKVAIARSKYKMIKIKNISSDGVAVVNTISDEDLKNFTTRMDAVETEDELKAIGAKIGETDYCADSKAKLKAHYSGRLKQLREVVLVEDDDEGIV